MTQREAMPTAEFQNNRDLLFGVAYRVLGSVADAEDVVQEAWLRWHRVDAADIADPRSFLIKVSTRLALDRLRRAKARRETYVGPWLPEPLPTGPEVEESAELADSVSMAMLVVLETLSPLERVVFLLREAFDFSFADIADILERSEPAVRQVASRARSHVRARRPRFRHDHKAGRRVTERFLAACLGADMDEMLGMLAPEVTLRLDGNGLRGVAQVPVHGPVLVSRMLVHGITKFARPAPGVDPDDPCAGLGRSLIEVNGGPAALIMVAGKPVGVLVADVDPETERVVDVWIVANPEKLANSRVIELPRRDYRPPGPRSPTALAGWPGRDRTRPPPTTRERGAGA
ncbi:MAG TPA: RNA polymerase sigma factor SigJ [Mycobacteriales bacterium]|nr:RNA polymerase sigma factor SigJ [Mycobacteriales bacterium]